jgi:glycerol-3-phosphate acyltransferase PlsY
MASPTGGPGTALDAVRLCDSNAPMIIDILLVAGGYLFGSISTAIVTCKLMGLPDPRTEGSGNPGATNVLRLGGKMAAFLTLSGDMLKGLVPVLVAQALHASPLVQSATALAAFLGHLYPVFFSFQGGKGVATALGVSFGLYWPVGLCVAGIWLLMAFAFRISSLSALTAMLLAPGCFWLLKPEPAFIGVTLIITVMLFWRHRTNIRDLLKGTEGRIELRSDRDRQNPD